MCFHFLASRKTSIHSSPILLPMHFNFSIIYQLRSFVSHNFVKCCGGGAVPAQKTGGLREFAAVRAAGRRGSVAAFCARFTPVNMFLLECFAFGSRLSICFYWSVLRLVHACQYVSIGVFCVWFTPVSFPLSGKERRLAGGCVSIPPWVGIAISTFSNVVRLSDLFSSLRD